MGKSTFMKSIGKTYVMVITTVGVALAVGRGGYEIGKDMAEKVSDTEKHNLHQSNLALNQKVRFLEDSLLRYKNGYWQEIRNTNGNYRDKADSDRQNLYDYFQGKIRLGDSFLDVKTNASLSVLSADSENTGTAYLSLPDRRNSKKRPKPIDVVPGQQWGFEYEGNEYILILESIQWMRSEFSARVREK